MSQSSDLTQTIILLVDKQNPSSEEDGIRVAAQAAWAMFMSDRLDITEQDTWLEWLSGSFAKVVRRVGSPNELNQIQSRFDPSEYAGSVIGTAEAFALRPQNPTDTIKAIKRLQVAGTQLPEGARRPLIADSTTVVLNSDLGMSTGKAAAQAAHALIKLAVDQPDRQVMLPINVRLLGQREFDKLMTEQGDVSVITDEGRTEIEPGSVTAFAF